MYQPKSKSEVVAEVKEFLGGKDIAEAAVIEAEAALDAAKANAAQYTDENIAYAQELLDALEPPEAEVAEPVADEIPVEEIPTEPVADTAEPTPV